MAQTIETVVDGGKVAAGPLGPTLGPTGVNIGQVVAALNEKTRGYTGMKVPVKIEIDDKKQFTIKIGTPPASALIGKKAGVEKGSGRPKSDFVGNITLEQVMEVVDMKLDDLQGATPRARAREVVGTCVSMGVRVEGEDPRTFIKRLGTGEFDSRLG